MTKAIFLVLLLVPTVVIAVGREKKLMRREKKIEDKPFPGGGGGHLHTSGSFHIHGQVTPAPTPAPTPSPTPPPTEAPANCADATATCPTGYYTKADAAQLVCGGPDCQTSTSMSRDTNTCCQVCAETVQGCEECTDGSTCTTCMDGYKKNGGGCQACPANCIDCSSGASTCDVCEDGYIQPNGKVNAGCQPCPENCERCKYVSATQQQCEMCAEGYKCGGQQYWNGAGIIWNKNGNTVYSVPPGSGLPAVCQQGNCR